MDQKMVDELAALGAPAAKFYKDVFNDLGTTLDNPLVRANVAAQLTQTWVQTSIFALARPDADPDDKWRK